MAVNNVQEPTRTETGQVINGTKIDHPAFATISAHRVNGQFHLFGSNAGHNGAVCIELHEACAYEDGHHYRIHGGSKTIAKVYLSEAQWVAFVSRMNMGSGTPCTLSVARAGDLIHVPDLPRPEKPAETLASRAQAMLDESQRKQTKAAENLTAHIDGMNISAKAKAELKNLLSFVIDHGQVNRNYQKKVLAEETEHHVAAAKVELDAMMTDAVTRFGLSSMQELAQLIASAPTPAIGKDD